MNKGENMEEKLNFLNKKRAFIISQIGEERLSETMKALDEIVDTQKLLPSLLVSITEYHSAVRLLPEL